MASRGRPSSASTDGRCAIYDPAKHPAAAIEHGRDGKSMVWIASAFGVSRQTVQAWIAKHPEFAEAMELARTHAQAKWEDAGQTGMNVPGFGGSVWSRSMAARFPDDWREVKGAEISGPGGGPIETVTRIERVIVNPED